MYDAMKRRAEKQGDAPGTARYIGPERDYAPEAVVFDYGPEVFTETAWQGQGPGDLAEGLNRWLKVSGIHDAGLVARIGECFCIHPLFVEDILNTSQRPKLQENDEIVLIVVKVPGYDQERQRISEEQLSLVWHPRWLVSFQETPGGVWEPVAARIHKEKSRLRRSGVDYLVIGLLDAVVDRYFQVLGELGEDVQELEARLLARPTEAILFNLYHLKREVLSMRNHLWPLQEILTLMAREDQGGEVAPASMGLLRDVEDHVRHAVDALKTLHDMLADMLDLHMSLTGMRLNAIMKVLTLIATIFIPLTFIAGIYGMNFEFMPELEWRLGYPLVLGLMALVAVGMLVYFRRRKWLG
jgi:magnesium transporter